MVGHLRVLAREEGGPTAIEYALIAILVSLAILGGVILIGTVLTNFFGYLGNQVNRP